MLKMRQRNWLNSTRTLGRRDVPDMCVKRLTIMQQSFDNDREDSAFKTINLIGQGICEDKDEMVNILTWGNSALNQDLGLYEDE